MTRLSVVLMAVVLCRRGSLGGGLLRQKSKGTAPPVTGVTLPRQDQQQGQQLRQVSHSWHGERIGLRPRSGLGLRGLLNQAQLLLLLQTCITWICSMASATAHADQAASCCSRPLVDAVAVCEAAAHHELQQHAELP
jgi:hypothetical protein